MWAAALFGVVAVFFVFSVFLAPYSVSHGYYVSFAKLMAEGLTAWRDFSLADLPLGVWLLSLPYRVVGTEASGAGAQVLVTVVHLLNMGLLGMLMRRIGVKGAALWMGLLFYVVTQYSADALMTNTEPFAVCFLLAAANALVCGSRNATVAGAVCFALAVACKMQCAVLTPVMLGMALWNGGQKGSRLQKGVIFVLGTLVVCGLTWACISALSGNAQWTDTLNWRGDYLPMIRWRQVLVNVVILVGRCSLYFLILALPAWKRLPTYGRQFCVWTLLTFVCLSALICFDGNQTFGMFLCPFVAVAFACLWEQMARKIWAAVLLSAFVLPGYLLAREFAKLEGGEAKALQREQIDEMKKLMDRPAKVVAYFGKCFDYQLGAQVYSEVPHLRPVDVKNTKFGTEGILDVSRLIDGMTEADCIILGPDGASDVFNNENSDTFFEATEDMKGVGVAEFMVYVKK